VPQAAGDKYRPTLADHVAIIKEIIREILEEYEGYGYIHIEIRNGEFYRISKEVPEYTRGHNRDGPC